MSKYELEFVSRRVYPGPQPESISSLFDLIIMCHFEDDSEDGNEFNVFVVSDYARMNETVEYTGNQIANNCQPDITINKIRNNIQIVAREGFYGTFFQYHIIKFIPLDGNFKWFRGKFQSIKTNLDPEFLAGFGQVNNGPIS